MPCVGENSHCSFPSASHRSARPAYRCRTPWRGLRPQRKRTGRCCIGLLRMRLRKQAPQTHRRPLQPPSQHPASRRCARDTRDALAVPLAATLAVPPPTAAVSPLAPRAPTASTAAKLCSCTSALGSHTTFALITRLPCPTTHPPAGRRHGTCPLCSPAGRHLPPHLAASAPALSHGGRAQAAACRPATGL